MHDKIKSVNIKGLIVSSSVKGFMSSWNISVHEWLKHYVYIRLLSDKKRGGTNAFAALMSFTVSAIWHGFYPGYYSFFFGAFIVDLWNKLATPIFAPKFKWVPPAVQNVCCSIFYYIPCSYFAIAFVLLSFENFHPVYMSMSYYQHVFFLGTIPILIALQPKRKRPPTDEQRKQSVK